MKKAIIYVVLSLLSCAAYSQKNIFYWGNGHLITSDSLKNYKSIKAMLLAAGAEQTSVSVLEMFNAKTEKKYLASVWYVPFIHKPVLVNGEVIGDYNAIVRKFNEDNYNTSGSGFSTDFDILQQKPNVDTAFIAHMIGRPDTLESDPDDHNGRIWVYRKKAFQLTFTDNKLSAYKAYDFRAARREGLGISDFGINLSESGDYVTGFRVNYFNFSAGRIKYIYTTITAINAVGDVVQTKIAKSIGPVEPNDVGSYTFDNLFFSKIIDKVKISSLKVQYFDGSVKTFTMQQIKKMFIN